MTAQDITIVVNGDEVRRHVEPPTLLIDFLREELDLRGAKPSCGVQVCGACTVLVDWRPVSSCCTLAVQVSGKEVLTVEGLSSLEIFAVMEESFISHAALQCGFCTPGMLLSLAAIAHEGASTDRENLPETLRGCVCRCTGYQSILDSASDILAGAEMLPHPFRKAAE